MLELVGPDRLAVQRSSVERDDGDLEVTLAHADRDDWTVVIAVTGEEAIVYFRAAHERFGRWAEDEQDVAWTQRAVDFVAALLRGEVQVDALWSGEDLLRARHSRRGSEGDVVKRGSALYFSPGWLMPWRMRRTSERPTFMTPSP